MMLHAGDYLKVREYPWPYNAALAFSNDCDYLTFDAALALSRLMNSPESDNGLGLNVSDSFFFFQHGSRFPNSSYFEGLTGKPSRAAPAMRELISTGHYDTTHALGDFEHGNFRRLFGHWCREEIAKHNLSLPIFSNHGGFSNRQNIGRLENCFYHGGDDPHSPCYLLDIIEDMGVRYVWTDTSKTKWINSKPVGEISSEADRNALRQMPATNTKPLWDDYQPSWNFDQRKLFEKMDTRARTKLQGFIRYDGFFFPMGTVD